MQRTKVDAIIERFSQSVRDAVVHYGVDHDEVEEWLTSYYWLAVLRRDALRSFEKLERHQFYHGTPAVGERIVLGSKVMEFWNIPSLVRGMMAMGQRGLRGVNLCLIRDPLQALHSFWVIAVVNGESLTILTDRDREAHPGARYNTRLPDRNFARRASRHWFPYELLEIEEVRHPDDPEVVIRLKAAERDQLVPINAQAVALTDFSELFPSDVIWLSLLFQLISDHYLVENKALPALSYTAEMIRQPELLLSARPEIIAPSTYTPLANQDLTLEDITDEKTEEQWEHEPVGHNEWMIERYGSQVPEAVFNVLGRKDLQELPEKVRVADLAVCPDLDGITALDPLGFGTAESMQNDRLWTARHNLCVLVQQAAMLEFEETVDEVLAWYRRRIAERRDWIIEQSILGELFIEREENYHDPKSFSWDLRRTVQRNLISIRVGKEYYQGQLGFIWTALHLDPADAGDRGYYRCAETEAQSVDYHAVWRPRRAAELALVLGLPLEELPWQLQRWSWSHDPFYTGNPLLTRCDPSDWVLQNPWSADGPGKAIGMEIVVHLSRRGVNAIRKRLALPKFDWKAAHAAQDAQDKQDGY